MEALPGTRSEPVRRFEWTRYETPVHAIARTVADVTETDPTGIDPLYDAVDPDALEALLVRSAPGEPNTNAVVRFEYQGYDVALCEDGDGFLFEAEAGDDAWSPT